MAYDIPHYSSNKDTSQGCLKKKCTGTKETRQGNQGKEMLEPGSVPGYTILGKPLELNFLIHKDPGVGEDEGVTCKALST